MSQIVPVNQIPEYYYGPAQPKKGTSMYFILGILFLLIFLVIYVVQPYTSFQPIRDWFAANDPQNQYNCIPLNVLAYYNSPKWLFGIVSGLNPESTSFQNDFEIDFIYSLIRGQAVDIVPGGHLTPKTLCKSLIPDNYPPPSSWGTHEWPVLLTDWKLLFGIWGVNFNNQEWVPNNALWTAPNNQNFLFWHWGIPADSPLIEAFVTNQTTSPTGTPLYPSAIQPLLGITEAGAAGWVGFLRAGAGWKDSGINEINRTVWSDDIPTYISNPPKNPGGCNGGSIAGSVISGGLSAAFFGFTLGGETAGPLGAGIGFLAGALASGIATAFSQNGCLN